MIELSEVAKSIVQNWKYDKESRTLRHKETWNAAIEAVVDIATSDYHITAEEIRKLKI